MNEIALRKSVFVLAVLGTSFALFSAVRAEDDFTEADTTECIVEICETQESDFSEETSVSVSEICDITEETELSEQPEMIAETEMTEEPEETQESVPDDIPEIEYDVPSFVINGWYVPAFDYNDNGTVTYYLPDGTPFYNVEMNELELPSYAWAYTGLRGYVDYQYGSVNYLTEEEMSSFETAADYILSGQGA